MASKTDLAHYQNTALYALELFALLGADAVRLMDLASALGLSVYRTKTLLTALVDHGVLAQKRVRKAGRVWVVSLRGFSPRVEINRELAAAHLTMLRKKS